MGDKSLMGLMNNILKLINNSLSDQPISEVYLGQVDES